MAETKGDLLMKFVQTSGEAVKAEGSSVLKKDDKLLFDFWPGKFFEIEEFGIGLNVEDSETSTNTLHAAGGQGLAKPAPAAAAQGHKPKFATWRLFKKQRRGDAPDIAYPVVLEPFSFTRMMDKASPIFFQNCCNSVSFDSATLVKRKVTGSDLALQTFLRIDFKNVLIIGLDWDDGSIVKEKCKFICREMSVQYKQQSAGGALGAASSAEWSRDLATRSNA